ncbi:putative homoserine dehydrogenase-like protein [Evansella vedderi]|uniref:Homoserine dehydrogenase-like protein n=1 Tax=Evansella vedderi TaxID=38282 RepID=A0ABT9ZPU7_9BACI|nr:SAF domain-containing protein [Evansella vedderi]MDQ0253261.1 putative homoserine dehydrogenase-like protein [Evansella vedderi]
MIYHHLFQNAPKKEVNVAVIGTGHFGKAIVTQQLYNEFLSVRVIMDIDTEAARQSFIDAGIDEELIHYSRSVEGARVLFDKGKYIYTDEIDVIMNIDAIDVVCEATGVPEAGAVNAKLAIENKKHVAMVNKETDSAIGPILKQMAQENGVVYTPVDGDQHGLLVTMYEWAKVIGLTVIAGGKARDGEFIYNEQNRTVTIEADGITVHETATIQVSEEDVKYFGKIPDGRAKEYVAKRTEILKGLPGAGAFDLCELTIMANYTNLSPDKTELFKAPLKITELPVAYCSEENEGIFSKEGIIDVTTCFRREDEAGMGGGVFLVVRCDNAYSNYILTTKGQIPNYDRSTAVIYRPYHLCGVETSTSIATAGLLNMDTGSLDYRPRYDLVKKAARDIKAGEVLGNDHDYSLEAMMVPAVTMEDENPIPGHIMNGNKAKVDIKAGEWITYAMVERPENSTLWELRELQDEKFLSSTKVESKL